MQPRRFEERIAETVKGQFRSLSVSDALDVVITMTHIGGRLLSDSAYPRTRLFVDCPVGPLNGNCKQE